MSGLHVITRFILFALLFYFAACSSTVRAPVTTRGDGQNASKPLARSSPSISQTSARHIVATGDTLYSIAWRYGLDYRAIASWNRIGKPYTIYPGQALRLRASPAKTSKQQRRRAASVKPKNKRKTTAKNKPSLPPSIKWSWPTPGKLIRSDSPVAKKGIDIGGSAGQGIKAAATGDVVYSGSGLLGYGRLIIVKHNDVFLSAYAHNSKILVKEGERVKRGQQIALMGRANNGQALLHFEIRKNGKPVNPLTHLPQQKS